MSGVIKRRGDEGQRGKKRWRTEEKEGGDAGKRSDEDRKKWEQERARALLLQTGYYPRTFFIA